MRMEESSIAAIMILRKAPVWKAVMTNMAELLPLCKQKAPMWVGTSTVSGK